MTYAIGIDPLEGLEIPDVLEGRRHFLRKKWLVRGQFTIEQVSSPIAGRT